MEESNSAYIKLVYSELAGRTFEKGTEVGFNKEEIKKTGTEDLLALRKSVLAYLKSKKLKKRNANFMEVYQRINQELKERKILTLKEEESINQGFVKVIKSGRSQVSATEADSPNDEEGELFLKRKHSMTISLEIPSFFNDKKNQTESKMKKVEEKPVDKPCLTGTIFLTLRIRKRTF
jgi:hypothetical protein